jgi:pimeloyl-ACP methyl ester carboxylesterase
MGKLIPAAVAFLCALSAIPPSLAAPPISEGTATTADGTRIYYRVAGQGDDVVLAPFALFHVDKLDALATDRRRIVTYDPRGRGRSEKVPPEKVSLDLLHSDLEAVRRAVGAERIAVIGWSGGGMEMFVYALRHPGRVTRLVQVAPVGPRAEPYFGTMMADRDRRTDMAALKSLEERWKAGAYASRDAELCRDLEKITRPATVADPAKVALLPDVCDHENEWPKNTGPYFGALMKSFGSFDWRPDIAKVTIPRLVVHGEKDNIPLAASEEWVRGAPNARLFVVPDSGHWPHYEQPETTPSAIRSFLEGGWPDGAAKLD